MYYKPMRLYCKNNSTDRRESYWVTETALTSTYGH